MPLRPGPAVALWSVVWWCALAALAHCAHAAPAPIGHHQLPPQSQQSRCDRHRDQVRKLAHEVRDAQIVLDARLRTISHDNVFVTFKVLKVLKGAVLEEFVRLQVSADPGIKLKMDGRYLLLVKKMPTKAYVLMHPPTPRGVAKCLRITPERKRITVVGPRRKAVHVPLDKKTVKIGEKLKLNCPFRNRNPLNVQWYKDNKPLHLENQRIKLQTKKRQLNLVITKMQPEDSGRYECRVNGNSKHCLSRADVNVHLNEDSGTSGEPCPIPEPQTFCQNGGTCLFIPNIKETLCKCPEGYKGFLCENKDVSNLSSTYHSYTCKKGTFSSFYC